MTFDEAKAEKDRLEREALDRVNALQARLQAEADCIFQNARACVDQALQAAGCSRCQRCDGTGALERLDSGYMRRFGLQEWKGCPNCGGHRDCRGSGIVAGGQTPCER